MKSVVAAIALSFLLAHFPAEAETGNSVRNRIKIRKKTHVNRASQDVDEDYNLEKMELLSTKRKNLIQDIKRFLREARSEDQKAELNLRLGGLYMEDYYSGLAKAQQVFEVQAKTYEQNKQGKRAPKFDNSDALASLDKARAIYRDLIQRYPGHPRRDEMFYFLAVASLDRGKTNEGMEYFQRLVKETPDSKYGNDALVQLGDHFFDNSKFAQAEVYYERLIQKKYKPLLPYAVYKKGWCAYNQQKPAVALAHFKWAIQNESQEEGASSQVKVRSEALRDITLPFVDLRQVEESVAFFKAFGDPYYRNGIETMAQLYYEAGQYQSAIALYDLLLRNDPNFAKNPSYEIAIVDALKLKNEPSASIQRLFSRFPNYLENSNWYEINAANPQVIGDAVKAFEETARKYAFQYHAEGQKTKNEALYNVAKQLYAKYIEFFPRSPQAPQVRFYLAEILYKQAQFVPAAEQYWIVYKDGTAGKLRPDAIRYALSALDKQLNMDRKKAGLNEISSKSTSKLKAKEEAELEAVPYSEVENRFIEISSEYLDKYPKAKDAPDVLYTQAYLHYTHHELVKAYKSFWTLVQAYPAHLTAYPSANLILDILNRKKDYPKLIAACQKFLQTKELNKPAFRTEVADVLRRAELKRIQLAEEKGEFKLAADGYIEYTKAYGQQDEALFEKALYNASVNYTKAELFLSAVETQEKFLRRFPKSALRENMVLGVAKTYETLANNEKAAIYFEMFGTQYPRNAQAKNALRIAGLYYWGSGNVRKAETTMVTYLRSYPNEKVVERDLVDVYESSNQTDKLVNYYLNARAARGVSFADYLSYSLKIAEQVGKKNGGRLPAKVMEEAMRVAQKHGKDIVGSPKGVEAMSKLVFWYTNLREEQFARLKLALPQRQLEANLQRKLALLKELEKEYGRVVSLGSGEWGLGAIFKTASVYRQMAEEVLQAPVPAELSAEQVEQYRAEIAKQMVTPFNEKALAMAVQCLDKAQEFNLLSSWTSRCYSLASQLQPERYPMVRTFYLPSAHLALLSPGENSKVAMGSMKSYAYPFFSAGFFGATADRTPASTQFLDLPSLYDGARNAGGGVGAVPGMVTYRVLSDERKDILKGAAEGEKPADVRKGTSFAFLHLMRLVAPQRALPLLMEAIQRDPTNPALHNLLGLTYLEMGNLPAAKVTWLSMVARGVKKAAVWNNLGVVAYLEGKETAAMDYFAEATEVEPSKEASTNLGFVSLKYRNGFEAKKHFEKAMAQDDEDVTAKAGLAVAQLQNREIDAAKDGLVEVAKKYKSDPYARLSLGYFLLDVEKENDMARQLITEYMDAQNVGNDMQFRQALQEARHARSAESSGSDSLPSIE